MRFDKGWTSVTAKSGKSLLELVGEEKEDEAQKEAAQPEDEKKNTLDPRPEPDPELEPAEENGGETDKAEEKKVVEKGAKVVMVKDTSKIGVVTKRKKAESKWAVDFSQSKGKREVWVNEREIKAWEPGESKPVKNQQKGNSGSSSEVVKKKGAPEMSKKEKAQAAKAEKAAKKLKEKQEKEAKKNKATSKKKKGK